MRLPHSTQKHGGRQLARGRLQAMAPTACMPCPRPAPPMQEGLEGELAGRAEALGELRAQLAQLREEAEAVEVGSAGRAAWGPPSGLHRSAECPAPLPALHLSTCIRAACRPPRPASWRSCPLSCRPPRCSTARRCGRWRTGTGGSRSRRRSAPPRWVVGRVWGVACGGQTSAGPLGGMLPSPSLLQSSHRIPGGAEAGQHHAGDEQGEGGAGEGEEGGGGGARGGRRGAGLWWTAWPALGGMPAACCSSGALICTELKVKVVPAAAAEEEGGRAGGCQGPGGWQPRPALHPAAAHDSSEI